VIPYLEVFIATIPAQNVIIQGDDPVIELKFLLADSTQIALYNQIAPIIHWSFVGDLFPVQFIPSGIGSVPFAGEKFRNARKLQKTWPRIVSLRLWQMSLVSRIDLVVQIMSSTVQSVLST
jgi:hypothetical protein